MPTSGRGWRTSLLLLVPLFLLVLGYLVFRAPIMIAEERQPETKRLFPHSLGPFWLDAHRPTHPYRFLRSLEMQIGTSVDASMIVEVRGKDEEWNNVVIPTAHYLWARQVCRGAKRHLSDTVVVANAVWKGFHSFAENLRLEYHKRNGGVTFILLLPSAAQDSVLDDKIVLDSLHVHILLTDSFDGLSLLALIEVADLYIAWNGEGARSSAGVDTPTIGLLPKLEDTVEIVTDSRESSAHSPGVDRGSVTQLQQEPTGQKEGEGEAPQPEVEGEQLEGKHYGGAHERAKTVHEAPEKPEGGGESGAIVKILSYSANVKSLLKHSLSVLERAKVDLAVASYVDTTTGYGRSAQSMLTSLARANVSMIFYPIGASWRPSLWKSFLKPQVINIISRTGSPTVFLGYYVPHEPEGILVPRLARKAKLAYLYTTFETSMVPSGWHEYINRYDKLLVPCRELQEAFKRGGVTIPIEVMPFGVDVDEWPVLSRTVKHPFRFLMYADGSWDNHRKGYALAYRAFVEEFGAEDPSKVELLLKLTVGSHTLIDVEKSIPRNVRIIKDRIAQPKLLTLLRKAHCLVFPSSGEGFGLPPREAMASGIPVIVAGFAGLESIALDDISFPLEWTWDRAAGYDDLVAFNNNSSDFGHWAKISLADLKKRMREAMQNPLATQRKGTKAARFIRQYQTSAHFAGQFLSPLMPILHAR